MSRIPLCIRVDGRYMFRRRIHVPNIISKPIAIALRTADPSAARTRSAVLAACFEMVKAIVRAELSAGQALTGHQIEKLFRGELEETLQFFVNGAFEQAPWSAQVLGMAAERGEAARRMIQPEQGTADGADTPIAACSEREQNIRSHQHTLTERLTDTVIAERLQACELPDHPQVIASARTHMLRAHYAAGLRVQRLYTPEILTAADPVAALLSDLPPKPVPAPDKMTAPPYSDGPFAMPESRRFSETIASTLADLKAEGVWKGIMAQQQRIMETFCWITGDKPLGLYSHLDVAAFKQGLLKLPANFQFGTLRQGAMSRPFAEVIRSLAPIAPGKGRNPKTVNRDLSTMQTVSRHLSQTGWRSRSGDHLVLDFGKVRIPVKKGGDLRPPWRKAHMECLFASPLYTGGGHALHRLQADVPKPTICHDAAYFAPLIWYYTSACREEICGLEVADIVLDHATPHFHIRDNLTRGRDGEMAGQKREARQRLLPIPPEVLRLGFADYVRAVEREGCTAVFPELYVSREKRGGGFFYDRAWVHMVAYIEQHHTLPLAAKGKKPDIHSIRALGSSFYEIDGASEILRADVMGHARQGTNAIHYSKRAQTEGMDVVLAERLAFMSKYIPNITAHLRPAPIHLLPLGERSRTGKPGARKPKSKAG